MSEGSNTFVTIIGSAYFQPITDLLERLSALPAPTDSKQMKKSKLENGYSAALCILSVACLESYLMRVRYLTHQDASNQGHNTLAVFQTLYPKFSGLDALTEVYVVRDLLVHNHLWEVQYKWDERSPMDLVQAVRSFIKKDWKYEKSVNLDNYQTVKLNLHIFPTRIDRHDVSKVLLTVWDTLLYLELQDRNQCYVSRLCVRKNGVTTKFNEIIKEFCAAVS